MIVGNTSSISPARVGVQRAVRREPAEVDALLAVDLRLLTLRQQREEEVRVEADLHLRGGDPAREPHELVEVAEHDAGLLVQLAHRGSTVGLVAVALARVDGAPRKHPHAAHEARLRRAPDEQHLEPLAAAAQQDHARRLTGSRGRPGLNVSPGPGRSLSSDARIG